MTVTEPKFPVQIARGTPIVIAPQEIDITNADRLRAALLYAAAHPSTVLVVDMTRTRFHPPPAAAAYQQPRQQVPALPRRGQARGRGGAAGGGDILGGDEIRLADQSEVGRLAGDDPAVGQVPPL
jgi:hypothetical protein